MARIPAVLETSFWIAAYRAEVAANCLDLFDIIVPRAVEAEIMSVQPEVPRREYPYTTLFRHLRVQMRDPPDASPAPLPFFGAGEAAAIPLAHQLGIALLVNERRAVAYAASLSMPVVTVPAVVVALRDRQIISDRAARTKLELIRPITAAATITDAMRALDELEGRTT
jgi:predicted nucleic acid-binding protein